MESINEGRRDTADQRLISNLVNRKAIHSGTSLRENQYIVTIIHDCTVN